MPSGLDLGFKLRAVNGIILSALQNALSAKNFGLVANLSILA